MGRSMVLTFLVGMLAGVALSYLVVWVATEWALRHDEDDCA